MTQELKNYITQIAKYVNMHRDRYSIAVASPIIGQAVLESWKSNENRPSLLARTYHNYFGMKCGSSWKGKCVDLGTREEYIPGQLTNITGKFRVYNSMEDGVIGYFNFIQAPRYHNLRGISDPRQYLQIIKNDGYATSSKYVDNIMSVIMRYNLMQFDNGEIPENSPESPPPSKDLESVAREVIRGKYGNMPERKQRVEADGYDYETVRGIVNRLYKEGRV